MAGYAALTAVAIVEKDTSGDVMLTWAYPSVSTVMKEVILARTRLQGEGAVQFSFSRFDSLWMNIFTSVLHEDKGSKGLLESEEEAPRDGPLPRVNAFSICLLSKEFNPELCGALASLFSRVYCSTGSPIDVMKGYLSVITRGACSLSVAGAEQTFNCADYDRRAALLGTPLKDVMAMLGMEGVLIWTALMMRKRIVVYCDRLSVLLKVIRAFPLYVSHRQDWDILRPYVNLEEQELEEMKKAGVYCAGFTDNSILSRTDLYDVYVDVNARSVSVSDSAKGDFRLGAFHKELAGWMVSAAEDPDVTNQQIVKELSGRTKGFLQKLESLQVEDEQGNLYISYENLKERGLPPHMDRFCYAVAAAEGMAKTE